MIETPVIAESLHQNAAVVHLVIPRDQIQREMGPAIGEIMAALSAQGVSPAGPLFSRHLRIDPAIFDFEVGVPVAGPVTVSGRVKPGELPAARVVRTVYQGPYEGLGGAWQEFSALIQRQGHACSGSVWERYIYGPETASDPSTWRTELNKMLA
jgi:hypothetical protein